MATKVKKPKLYSFIKVDKIRPWWNWRIREGHEYEIMGGQEDYHFVWANGSYVALPKSDEGEFYTISKREMEDGHECNPYSSYP